MPRRIVQGKTFLVPKTTNCLSTRISKLLPRTYFNNNIANIRIMAYASHLAACMHVRKYEQNLVIRIQRGHRYTIKLYRTELQKEKIGIVFKKKKKKKKQ